MKLQLSTAVSNLRDACQKVKIPQTFIKLSIFQKLNKSKQLKINGRVLNYNTRNII